jgi:hypothetical protein
LPVAPYLAIGARILAAVTQLGDPAAPTPSPETAVEPKVKTAPDLSSKRQPLLPLCRRYQHQIIRLAQGERTANDQSLWVHARNGSFQAADLPQAT